MADYTPTTGGGAEGGPDPWGRMPGDPQYGVPPSGGDSGGDGTNGAPATGGSMPPSSAEPTYSSIPVPGASDPSAAPVGSSPFSTYGPTGAPSASTPSGGGSAGLGGGWDTYATDPHSFEYGLMTALKHGLTGDAAIHWMNSNGWAGAENPAGGGIQYYPSTGQYGLPGGYYAAPGAGGLDLIRRAPGGTPSASGEPGWAASGTGGYTAPPGVGTPFPSVKTPESDKLFQMLMQRAQQGLHINPNDPTIQAQLTPFIAQQQNAMRNSLAALAERQGPSANLSAETRLANENVGKNTSAFEGQLMQQELMARRQEIAQALAQAQALNQDEEARALQQQLAQYDNALRYAQLGEQGREFDQNLAQRGYEFDTSNQTQIGLA